MTTVEVTGRSGTTRTLDSRDTGSLMQILRDAGYDELLALCGGCLSCATCHVIVHPDDFAQLPPATDDENDLLDSAEARTPTSRLSCQIRSDPALQRLRVTIADEG